MRGAALALAKRGLAVFPLKPRDKIPLTAHGCKDASCSPERIEAWWSKWPDSNIGVATGKPSGIWVLDIDGQEGEATLRKIEKAHAELPVTVESITGGGGRHLLFSLPDFDGAPTIRNSAKQLGAGLDVRAEGGYIVVPPSIHPSGRKYVWSVDTAKVIAEAPAWLLGLLQPTPVASLDERRPDEHWQRVIRNGADEGVRNATAASIAGKMLRMGMLAGEAYEFLLTWNHLCCRPPLPEVEISRIIQSIALRELRRRQQ
jgi:hypothetical protein